MSPFAQGADLFCRARKIAIGEPEWGPTRSGNGRSIFWLLEIEGAVTTHRLHVEAYPMTEWRGYVVMVDFTWQARPVPVYRLNADNPTHEHTNHGFRRPTGIPPAVCGNREYRWAENRLIFDPDRFEGLPYARQMAERSLALPSAIRHIAGHANIDVSGIALPDYPISDRLF